MDLCIHTTAGSYTHTHMYIIHNIIIIMSCTLYMLWVQRNAWKFDGAILLLVHKTHVLFGEKKSNHHPPARAWEESHTAAAHLTDMSY